MIQLTNLARGVDGMYIPSARFKTTRISVNFFLPLSAETISANTILPSMLTTSSAKYPNYRSLQTALGNLYGASLSASSGKVGDAQIMTLTLTSLDDKFLDGERIARECALLLTSMIFEPNLDRSGNFKEADIVREKRLLLENIEGELNNKRSYALSKAESALFKDKVYGLPQYGTAEGAKALKAPDLRAAWQRALNQAYIRISVVGSKAPDEIFDVFKSKFSSIDREPAKLNIFDKLPARAETERVVEAMDVAQGKLVMEFTTNTGGSVISTAAFSVMCDLFGGGPYSLLFANVREKLSLCYYCAARSNRFKGIMTVDSGVEQQNAAAAEEEILRQLEVIKSGGFSDDDLAASKLGKADRIRTMFDSARETESFYMSQVFDDTSCTMEELLEAVSSVTREQIIEAAQNIKPALFYMLKPKEDGENE